MEKPLLVQLTEVKLVKTSILKLGFIHVLTMLINMFNCTFGHLFYKTYKFWFRYFLSFLFIYFIKKYAYSISLAIRLIIHVENIVKDTKVR